MADTPRAWTTRPERTDAEGASADAAAVRRIHLDAFPASEEADLIDHLRASGAWLPGLSWLAKTPQGEPVAHALLSRCHVADHPALALAPCATRPAHQGRGAGSAAITAALDAARAAGEHTVVVLGHPGYYPRFGFRPCADFGITPPPGHDWPTEAFLVLALDTGPLPSGAVRYPPPFHL
ncbi:N-acetyltransferase [Streptomyces sp. JJ66]|uniref:GNAT family N-acetyltransferase n=1 Tax=Streptomyces sp. JJ66 TaxID=2803843 RepID=UPI001C559D0B|nr:N-acetyltransferase [Streptomyces sp. JJ66]MBW1603460.1 N-acetyltransferase [Streptomyces sp. JJ66]